MRRTPLGAWHSRVTKPRSWLELAPSSSIRSLEGTKMTDSASVSWTGGCRIVGEPYSRAEFAASLIWRGSAHHAPTCVSDYVRCGACFLDSKVEESSGWHSSLSLSR